MLPRLREHRRMVSLLVGVLLPALGFGVMVKPVAGQNAKVAASSPPGGEAEARSTPGPKAAIGEAKTVEIVAHRGASWDAPENTLASMRLAWEQQADAIEMDCFLSRDGQIVVIHDADTRRTAGVSGKVADLSFEQLRRLDVGRWKDPRFAGERIPTLAEVLQTVPAGKRAFIEIKCGPEILPELGRVLKASGLKPAQTVIISFSEEVIAAVKKQYPERPAYWIAVLTPRQNKGQPRKVEEVIAIAQRLGADGVDLSAEVRVLTAEYARAIREAGLFLSVWTVNDVELARAMIRAGVQSITTDRPGWLREQLGLNRPQP
ncbi:MAG: glycerophosphodiester phosphodiesterase [Thermogemmata sp.]|nr:glycerophosphodiester phosphodiesterase [Thermogemmata fonticola]MCX8139057.1 glycerophosphodiester phosphodiesterase [Gemmataceae bacterium]